MLNHTKIGRYEVVSALGEGAMGTVYKAVDPLIERTVAIKTIKLDLSKEELAEFEERFYREAKSAGRLNHPNIVTIYDVGEIDDTAYIAMEYLEGESLREKLDSGVVLPLDMIVRIAARIASALNYAHENNVVHRDIKPANIMITSSRDVKIMDFGIAQIPTGSRTQQGTVLGSPKYMAPEQVDGLATDGRTDIFALGVVLYEMLTGTTPFNGDNLSAILHKILTDSPVPPSTLNPRVPPVFDRIISRAMAKRPADRYPTARAFARELKDYDAALSGEVQRSATGSKPTPGARANRAPAGPQDATLFLPPDKARQVMGASLNPSQSDIPASAASASWRRLLGRKSWVIAIPLLAVVAWGVMSQRPQFPIDRPPAPVASGEEDALQAVTAPVSETAAQLETPAISSAPTAPVAEPAVAPASRTPAKTTRSSDAVAPAADSKADVRNAEGVKTAVPKVAVPKASVSFAISPWGEVFVDGRSIGASPPLTSLELEAGEHRIEIRNQAFAPYRDTVNLDAGQSLKIRHKFK